MTLCKFWCCYFFRQASGTITNYQLALLSELNASSMFLGAIIEWWSFFVGQRNKAERYPKWWASGWKDFSIWSYSDVWWWYIGDQDAQISGRHVRLSVIRLTNVLFGYGVKEIKHLCFCLSCEALPVQWRWINLGLSAAEIWRLVYWSRLHGNALQEYTCYVILKSCYNNIGVKVHLRQIAVICLHWTGSWDFEEIIAATMFVCATVLAQIVGAFMRLIECKPWIIACLSYLCAVCYKLDKLKGTDEQLEQLHTILFKTKGKVNLLELVSIISAALLLNLHANTCFGCLHGLIQLQLCLP